MVERGAKAAVLQVRFLPPFTPQYYFQHRSYFPPLILNEVQFIPADAGTESGGRPVGFAGRFIPADAGNGGRPVAQRSEFPVYPRGCGERSLLEAIGHPTRGLSPRMRGTVVTKEQYGGIHRFIPADAGNGSTSGC